MKKNILLIGSQHGNELLGIRLYEYIAEKNPAILSSIEYYCANPLAFSLNKRFVETDMNRSYSSGSTGYEAERAKELVKHIRTQKYEHVIDCHTTTTEVGICFITSDRNEGIDRVINAAPNIKNLVLMQKDIAQLSLLGVDDNIVAIEVNDRLSTEESTLDTLLQMVKNLTTNKKIKPVTRYIYRTERFIDPSEIPKKGSLRNFISHGGSYPILYGGDVKNRTYKGLWAKKEPSESI